MLWTADNMSLKRALTRRTLKDHITDMQDFLGIKLQITSHRTEVNNVVAVTQGTKLA
jgi:hypothetical protein